MAGFELTAYGRFYGDHRGLQPMPISEIEVFRMVKDTSSEQDQYSVVPYEPPHVSGVNFTATDGRRWVRDNGSGYGKWVEF